MTTTFTLQTPPGFVFRAVMDSHGWKRLAPFAYDDDRATLYRTQTLAASGRVARLSLAEDGAGGGVRVTVDGALTPGEAVEVGALAGVMLGLDADLTPFYDALDGLPQYAWVRPAGAGRMLCSPTVWEDLVKTLFTTNTTWAQTIAMSARLVRAFGTPGPAHHDGTPSHAFPTPTQVAVVSPDALDAAVRAGYRSASLHALALSIASGDLNPQAWRDPALDSDTLYRRIVALRGFGPYAAASLLRLLGHHDRLSIDTECRAAFRRTVPGVEPTDRAIRDHYARYGRWQGLVSWMDGLAE